MAITFIKRTRLEWEKKVSRLPRNPSLSGQPRGAPPFSSADRPAGPASKNPGKPPGLSAGKEALGQARKRACLSADRGERQMLFRRAEQGSRRPRGGLTQCLGVSSTFEFIPNSGPLLEVFLRVGWAGVPTTAAAPDEFLSVPQSLTSEVAMQQQPGNTSERGPKKS
ncbi:hypothetical protein JRQ81_008081 [Phrynocephalus forsythii]|uniref:Uncharacterized protein n=1 Tax=Phrynocephalus forsythii TaxID=171643 RepID=A0A9Q1AT89_9SAUR|nr:hypothetical protein JRQ81_008081 [Phrynocephalus forsythii]